VVAHGSLQSDVHAKRIMQRQARHWKQVTRT
jgi:hypothetical protein